MTTSATAQVPPPLRRSMLRTKSASSGLCGGGAATARAGACPGSPDGQGSLATEATEKSSSASVGGGGFSSDEESFFKILTDADEDNTNMNANNSNHSNRSNRSNHSNKKTGNKSGDGGGSGFAKKSAMWNSLPNLDFNPFEETPVAKKPTFESGFFNQFDFSDNIKDPTKDKMDFCDNIVEPVKVKTEKVPQATSTTPSRRQSASTPSTSQMQMMPRRHTSLNTSAAEEAPRSSRRTPQRSRSTPVNPDPNQASLANLAPAPDLSAAPTMSPGQPEGALDARLSKGATKKKRIKVRASDLSVDSNGSGSVDKQNVEDAFRRWKTEHGEAFIDTGDEGSGIRRSLRPSSSLDPLPDGTSNHHIRVKVRRSKSNDETHMPGMLENCRAVAARINNSPAAVRSGSTRNRSKLASRTEGGDDAVGGGSPVQAGPRPQPLQRPQQPPQPMRRSKSLGRPVSGAGIQSKSSSDIDWMANGSDHRKQAQANPTLASTRPGPVAQGVKPTSSLTGHFLAENVNDPRPKINRACQSVGGAPSKIPQIANNGNNAKSLGSHLKDSNHEPATGGRSSRSVIHCRKSRAGSDDDDCKSVRSTSLINRRIRSRSLVRHPSGGLSGMLPSKKPEASATGSSSQNTKVDYLADPKDKDSAPSNSAAASSTPAPDPAVELLRLMQQTGITPEQLVKLREAGYSLNMKA